MKALPNGRIRKLFVDNCSSHITDESVQAQLNAARTSLYKFPPNATDLIQPADSFVIQKIKEVWQRRWEQYRLDSIRSQLFKPGSGRMQNPGKGFFLRLAADSVREVNNMREKHGISHARKAMIRTGLALDTNGQWREEQLSDALQVIIAKHRRHF